ncbi:MAG: ABC transporter ATP-binding protein [Acidobacteria bacterium]|jgi:lipopolysaccharide transport system ATP-binding protein|nr:ABC transporter ATP-binding protein [Acidobacteriota bacterium]HEV8159054.1 ABC transporter ATP-binding protein [Pyrinomonadaceae bacterium]
MSLIIKVENVSKQFYINRLRPRELTLGSTVMNVLKKPFTRQHLKLENEVLWALKNISFEVKQGDTLGIIGGNGAGKSTLLKILSRIIKPTSGRVKLRGRLGCLIEVGTGFHPELSGRENAFLNGAIIGMKNREVQKKFDEIVAFAEIEKFIDTPVKFYSSGMYMRLAFAIAAHLDPEILIIDEVLAVGDAAFQDKCINKINEVANDGRTILFVSHSDGALHRICRTGLYLEHGRLKNFGEMKDVLGQYQVDYGKKN